jgi:DNA-binding NarL/FixJ family response regulator
VSTIVICDPEPIAMEGLRSLLESTVGVRVLAAETTLEDAADAVSDFRPDLFLVDRKFAHSMHPSDFAAAVIVWGNGMSEPEALALLHSGVSGVVSKTASLADLQDCVRSVASGRKWMDFFTRAGIVH